MKKHVAFLRGINVGGNNKISMTELKNVFEKAGFRNVHTYINSGNIIFETAKTDRTEIIDLIEKIILKTFKLSIGVVVRDGKNIKKLCNFISDQLQNNNEQKTDILFLWNKYDSKKSLKLIKGTLVDNLDYFSGAIIWSVDRLDYSKSAMVKFVGTELYKNMTARNVNTVRKLAELMA